jgi:hypothetical protein
MRVVGLVGLGCGIILGGGRRNSLDLFDLRWVMVLRSDFDIMCGMGISI